MVANPASMALLLLLTLGSACGQFVPKDASTLLASKVAVGKIASPASPDGAVSDDPAVLLSGRILPQSDGSWLLAWSLTQIEIGFTGTGLRATLYDRSLWSKTGSNKTERNYYDVWLDGQRHQTFMLDQTSQQVVLAQDLPATSHVLRLIRRTEAQNGFDVFAGVEPLDGALSPLPTSNKQRSFLFIGDSNLTGWGIDAPEATATTMCQYTSATQDAQQAYPALLAQRFDAKLALLGYSGKGIARNRDWQNDPNKTLPWLFERTLPITSSPSWPHQNDQLDLIYINAGGNDFAAEKIGGNSPPAMTAELFAKAYVVFLRRLRLLHPDAAIVLGLGPTIRKAENLAAASKGIELAISELADDNISEVRLPVDQGQLGYACDWHPSRRAHVVLADLLEQHLRAKYPDW